MSAQDETRYCYPDLSSLGVPGYRTQVPVFDVPDLNAELPAPLAAEYAGVTRHAIYNWRRRGHLKETQPGLYRLIDIAKAEHATRKRARRE